MTAPFDYPPPGSTFLARDGRRMLLLRWIPHHDGSSPSHAELRVTNATGRMRDRSSQHISSFGTFLMRQT